MLGFTCSSFCRQDVAGIYEHACPSFAAPFCAVVIGTSTEHFVPTRFDSLQLSVVDCQGLAHGQATAFAFVFSFSSFGGAFSWFCSTVRYHGSE